MNMPKNYDFNSPVNQRIKEKFVRQNVIYCVSGWVEESFEKGIFDMDEVENLWVEDEDGNLPEVFEWWISQIKDLRDIPVIAEGGYSLAYPDIIREALKLGADNICIGTAISDICTLTKNHAFAMKEILEELNDK